MTRLTVLDGWLISVCLVLSFSALAEDVARGVIRSPAETRPDLPEYKRPGADKGYVLPPAPTDSPHDYTRKKSGPRFLLNRLNFEGNTAISDEELLTVAEDYYGRVVYTSDLEAIRLRLTQYYIGQGYVTSGALLPDQTITNGEVTYLIVEGELADIRLRGHGRLNEAYISDRLMLGAGPPLNQRTFQERFQLLLTDPLIDRLNGRLLPGDNPGESVLDVEVTRKQPYGLSFTVDNHGSPSTGTEQLSVAGWLRNLTTFGDLLDMAVTYKEGAVFGEAGFEIPVSRYDTRIGFRIDSSDTEIIEEVLRDLDIESEFQRYDLYIEHPLIKTLETELNAGLKLSHMKNESFLLSEPFSFSAGENDGESKVSVIRIYLNGSIRDTGQVLSYASTINYGVDLLEATVNEEQRPDTKFVSWLGQIQYARRVMDNGAQIRLRGDIQLSSEALLPMEQFAIGGSSTVRGYRENERVRDEGYIASAEFIYPLSQGSSFGNFSLLTFADTGDADNKSQAWQDPLFSVGTGILWQYRHIASAELIYGHAIENVVEQGEDSLQSDGFHLHLRINAL